MPPAKDEELHVSISCTMTRLGTLHAHSMSLDVQVQNEEQTISDLLFIMILKWMEPRIPRTSSYSNTF